ncbi:MAG: hypothetical protein EOP02_18135 [Proteobacteria bacterium]|nr:MAG: hypothetical protein EOP02_18135 [Pseudomonadota bacterium]
MVNQALESPVLRRYAEICTELLVRARPLSTLQAVRTLGDRADSLGLTIAPQDRGRRLSDLAADRIGGPWQDLFWKGLLDKKPGAHVPALDGALSRLRAGTEASGYALAIALLYDSVDDAFGDLERPLPSPETLVSTVDAEALRLPRNELPRSAEVNESRRTRLRLAVSMVLSGDAIHLAARATGWSVLVLERVLLTCVTKSRVGEPASTILMS